MSRASTTAKGSRSDQRQQRLAAALKANLGKRKAQARARAAAAELPARRGVQEEKA
jgi:hypothetical protein